jgi:tetratricopeptide (TPR) repeat protein
VPPLYGIGLGVCVAAGIAGILVRLAYERRGCAAPWPLRGVLLGAAWLAAAGAVHAGIVSAHGRGNPLLVLLALVPAIVSTLFVAPELARALGELGGWVFIGAPRESSLADLPGLDRAQAAMKRGAWADAEREVQAVLAARPDHADALAMRAEIREHLGRPLDAAADWAAAADRTEDPERAAARLFRAVELLERADRRAAARAALDRFAAQHRGTRAARHARERAERIGGG